MPSTYEVQTCSSRGPQDEDLDPEIEATEREFRAEERDSILSYEFPICVALLLQWSSRRNYWPCGWISEQCKLNAPEWQDFRPNSRVNEKWKGKKKNRRRRKKKIGEREKEARDRARQWAKREREEREQIEQGNDDGKSRERENLSPPLYFFFFFVFPLTLSLSFCPRIRFVRISTVSGTRLTRLAACVTFLASR